MRSRFPSWYPASHLTRSRTWRYLVRGRCCLVRHRFRCITKSTNRFPAMKLILGKATLKIRHYECRRCHLQMVTQRLTSP